MHFQLRSHAFSSSLGFFLSLCIALTSFSAAAQTTPGRNSISQSPLLLGGGGVPGNLALVPSVEWPTVISVANTGSYSPSATYVGYFNSEKCYIYDQASGREWFEPNGNASNHTCSGAKQWSGNFLNWAATPTIDPFRSALTGGYRAIDNTTTTVLQKARHTGQSDSGNRMTTGQGIIAKAHIPGATPAGTAWDNFHIRLQGQGSEMFFSNWKDGIGGGGSDGEKQQEWVYYQPSLGAQWNNNDELVTAYTPAGSNQVRSIYRVKIRVKVCDPVKGLESNCEQYPNGSYKPVGLLQQYSETLRYSVFGYLNDESMLRDGGVLRAQQKFISPITADVGRAEWDSNTGVMELNPDSATTSLGRPISNSGVMNYLNKFGELNGNSFKSHDPVSELYYTALRYFKNQGNVPAYTSASPSHNANPGDTLRARWHDGFPVITDWDDPIQYACQKNVILGIGDVNTHRDKNLPGSNARTDEPAKPSQVSGDDTINVVTATNKVASLEGITINTPFTGRENSAFIAGMAYDANTRDLRPGNDDFAGDQTVSTYWVDVREGQVLEGRARNQYWLAAKYGGFKVPDDFGDPYDRTGALDEDWWWTNGQTLTTGDKRPDNFFVASDAANMIESLKQAFAQISNEVQSTTASLAANSTRLDTDTAVFQSRLDSRFWSGDLLARRIGLDGLIEAAPAWSVANALDNLADTDSRKIFTIAPPASTGDAARISTSGRNFTWVGLSDAQKALLSRAGETGNSQAQARLAYLRGDRSKEINADDRTQPFRQRGSRMGDIVNSDPQYVHQQNYGYSRLSWNGGAVASAYTTFRSSATYLARQPMVLVGSNDGMLHGFNASIEENGGGGEELFAFVPNSVFSNLINLTDPAYAHRYYVDGTPRVSDVWDGSSWKTMAVGTTGAGGKSVFALDITNPNEMTSASVKWEFSHPNMGYTVGQPSLVALPNERFGVVVSSGYHDSAQDEGYVWILDAVTGQIIKEISLPTTGNLGSPLASDTDYNQVADRVYVADTLGNVWRIDLSGNVVGDWGVPNSLGDDPLFVAMDGNNQRQAITAPLSSAFNEKNEHMVFFGTGSFYRNGDNEIPDDPAVDTFYGIVDNGVPINGRNDLLQQNIIREATVNGNRVRAVTNSPMANDDKGWFLDLAWTQGTGATGASGERVVAKATLRSDRVIFTSMTPSDDPCAFGGTSMTMALSLSSGRRLSYVYFDTNEDGVFDSEDAFSVDDGGEGDDIPWSGISDPEDGVIKGTSVLYKWLCYAGSSGADPKCIPVAGSQRVGRNSWREVREN